MALIKYNPNGYRPTTFASFIDRFFNDDFYAGERASTFSPHLDIAETDKEFELQFHLAGVKKDDITIDLNDDRLTVSGERKLKNEKSEKNYHSVESYHGSFSRSFYLPDHVNAEKIDASYEDGILNVRIPKDGKKETKKVISVK